MKLIFIDANIYLSFYDERKKENSEKNILVTLLERLEKDSDLKLFLPDQIQEEFIKKKASKKMLLEQLKCDSSTLPLIVQQDYQVQVDKTISDLNRLFGEIKKEYKKRFDDPDNDINKGLITIFNHKSTIKVKDTGTILKNAIHRNFKGHPPKNKDAISWECLLDYLQKNKKDISEIILVTNDNDYKSESDSTKINEYLLYEIRKLSTAKVHIFSNLSESINYINKKPIFTQKDITIEQNLNIVNAEVTTIADFLKGQHDWAKDLNKSLAPLSQFYSIEDLGIAKALRESVNKFNSDALKFNPFSELTNQIYSSRKETKLIPSNKN